MCIIKPREDTAVNGNVEVNLPIEPQTDLLDSLETLSDEIESLFEAITTVKNKLDQLETNSRLNCLLIHGQKEIPRENIHDVVLNILGKIHTPNWTISKDQISTCFRMGKKDITAKKPRPILVQFIRYLDRRVVWGNKKMLKGTNLHITELLPPARLELYREAQKYFNKQNVWTSDGKIVIKLPDGGKKSIISTGQLGDLKQKYAVAN